MNNVLDYQKEKEKRKRYKDTNYLFRRITGGLGDYGTNPIKIFGWSVYFVLTFGLSYAIIFCKSNGIGYGAKAIALNILDGLYFSGITFLTVGYGDINPNNFSGCASVLIKISTVAEGFIGVAMMSFFMVALVRKVLR